MFDHVTIRVADPEASERFYRRVLSVLGGADDLSLAAADARHPVTRRLHIGFAASSRERVEEFWRAGTAAGYRDDGPPGLRPQYRHDYYGAFLLDPDGNSAEALVHGASRERGIDHLWLRVADVEASMAFYEQVGARAGFDVTGRGPDRVFCSARRGSFSLVAGESPTENVRMAFPAAHDDELVDPDGNAVQLVAGSPAGA